MRWAVNAVLSRGPGYEPQPLGTEFDVAGVRGYFIDFTAKTAAPSAVAPDTLGPAAHAQLCLGYWDRWLRGDDSAKDAFMRTAGLLEGRAEARGSELRWLYTVEVPKYGLGRSWCSALAQGQIASVFVRLASLTGKAEHAATARAAIRPLLDESSELVVATPDGPVLEEAPSDPPSLILNGWIYALWGLWDVAAGLGDEKSRDRYDAGVACLARLLPRYDVGWWSRYSLYPHPIPDLAKPFYHRLHVDQLEAMYRLTGIDDFGRTARRFASYDRPLRRSLALGQKGLFTALRRTAA